MPPRFGAPAPKCAKCEKPVYAAEQAIGPASKIYHKPCLACTVCGRRLDSSLLVDHEGEPMCHNCYKAHLGQGKGGFTKAVPLRPAIGGSAAPSSLAAIHPGAKSATFAGAAGSPVDPSISQSSQQRNPFSRSKTIGLSNGTPLCARCEMPVYFAEQKQAANRKWHRACLRCDGCATALESGKLEEGPTGVERNEDVRCNIWCRTCYAKRFGPRGIGVAGMSLPEMHR